MNQLTAFPLVDLMQFLWLALVPIAIGFSYIYRLYNHIFRDYSVINENEDANPSIYPDSPDLWGTYRSNLYFGMRTKTPQALMTGLAWNSIDSVEGFSSNFKKQNGFFNLYF